MATVKTGTGVNYFNYGPSNSKNGRNTGSHVVGYESSRWRVERYSFTAPTETDSGLPITRITNFTLTFDTSGAYQYGSEDHYPTAFRYIVSSASDLWDTMDAKTITQTGNISFSNTKPQPLQANMELIPGTTYYIYIYLGVQTFGWRYWGSGRAMTVTTTDITYTACGAPTAIAASTKIIRPGDSFVVNWSGATAGTANPIAGYRVFWKVSSGGTVPTSSSYDGFIDVETTATSGSCSITLDNATRGHKVACGVITISSISSTYHSSIKTGASVTINSLPNKPSVSVSSSVIPSTGGSVTFTLAAGGDVDSSQTKTVYYSVGQDATKKKCGSSLTVNLSAAASYYFWTFDGLEYSSESSAQSITLNTKPILQVTDKSTTFSALGSTDGKIGDCQGWVNVCSPQVRTNKPGTLRVTFYSYSNDFSFYRHYSHNMANSNVTYNLYMDDILKEYYDCSQNLDYYLILRFSDGVEYSDEIRVPAQGYYSIPRAVDPSKTGDDQEVFAFNTFSDSNISGTIDGNFYNKVRIKFYKDGSSVSTSYSVSAKVGSKALVLYVNRTTLSGSYVVYDLIFASPENIPSGEKVDITISYGTTSINKTFTKSMRSCLKPVMSKPILSQSTISPFQEFTKNLQASSAWFFSSAYGLTDACWEAYEMENKSQIKLICFTNTRSKTVSTTLSLSGTTLIGAMQAKDIFGFQTDELGVSTYSGTYTFSLAWMVTNLYGAVFASDVTQFVLNFNSKPKKVEIKSFKVKDSAGNIEVYGDKIKYLQESMELQIEYNLELYTHDKVTVSFMISRDNGATWLQYAKTEMAATDGYRGSVDNSGNIAAGANILTYTLSTSLPEITDNNIRRWKIVVKNNAGTMESSVFYTNVIGHTSAQPNFLSIEYSTTGPLFSCVFNFSNFGYLTDSSLAKYTLKLEEGQKSISNTVYSEGISTNTNYTFGFEPSIADDWSSMAVNLVFTSTIEQKNGDFLISITKITRSNVLRVYNLSPTICYRKNCVGINVKDPTIQSDLEGNKNGVLVIGPTSNRSKVIFTSLTNLATINLETGDIAGFAINCGSWDTLEELDGYAVLYLNTNDAVYTTNEEAVYAIEEE